MESFHFFPRSSFRHYRRLLKELITKEIRSCKLEKWKLWKKKQVTSLQLQSHFNVPLLFSNSLPVVSAGCSLIVSRHLSYLWKLALDFVAKFSFIFFNEAPIGREKKSSAAERGFIFCVAEYNKTRNEYFDEY